MNEYCITLAMHFMHSLVASVLLYSMCVVDSCAEAVYSRNVSYYVECMANSFPSVWITRMHSKKERADTTCIRVLIECPRI